MPSPPAFAPKFEAQISYVNVRPETMERSVQANFSSIIEKSKTYLVPPAPRVPIIYDTIRVVTGIFESLTKHPSAHLLNETLDVKSQLFHSVKHTFTTLNMIFVYFKLGTKF